MFCRFTTVKVVMVWPVAGKRNDEVPRLKSVVAVQVELRTWHFSISRIDVTVAIILLGLRTWLSGGVSS